MLAQLTAKIASHDNNVEVVVDDYSTYLIIFWQFKLQAYFLCECNVEEMWQSQGTKQRE